MTRTSDMAQTDVAIIGAGAAGMVAYRAALRHTECVRRARQWSPAGRRDDRPGGRAPGSPAEWSVQRGDTVQQMLDSPFYHPVVEEVRRTALRDVQRALQPPAPLPEVCLECAT